MSIQNITVIGAGRMGGGIACNLARANYRITVLDPSQEAVSICVKAGAEAGRNAADALKEADLVITSLPLPKHVWHT